VSRFLVRLTSARGLRHIEVVAARRTHVGLAAQSKIRRGERITHVTNLGAVEQRAASRRRRTPRSRAVTEKRLRDVTPYVYPSKRQVLRQNPPAGPWAVELRDKKGRRFVWRSGLTYNQARAARKAARAAHYRDPQVARKGVS